MILWRFIGGYGAGKTISGTLRSGSVQDAEMSAVSGEAFGSASSGANNAPAQNEVARVTDVGTVGYGFPPSAGGGVVLFRHPPGPTRA